MRADMPLWKTAPFIRLLPLLILGILQQYYLPLSLSLIVTIVSLLFVGLLLPFATVRHLQKIVFIKGILLYALLHFSGSLLFIMKSAPASHHFQFGLRGANAFIIKVVEPPVFKRSNIRAVAEVEAVIGDAVHIATGRILVYFPKTDSLKIKYGARFVVKDKVERIQGSLNPGGFDYAAYMAAQQISFQLFVQRPVILLTSKKNIFYHWLYAGKFLLLDVLKKYIHPSENMAIAEALTLGYKDDLDKELLQRYSRAGVVHIIAISGLHIALIYVLLLKLLSLFRIHKKRAAVWIIVVLFLWLFTIITGASASALRSAVMFSFIITGKTWFRQQSVYNALAGSAFVLLCFNPYLIFDVGFQLSYLAVIGIIWYQPFFYQLLNTDNKWLNQLWNLCSVTIAAQLITTPATLYYFHQFPNTFLFSNLIAVPLSSALLIGCIALFILSGFTWMASWLGYFISLLFDVLNAFINLIDGFSFAVTEPVFLSFFGCIVLYISLLSFSVWFSLKMKLSFFVGLFSLSLFIVHLCFFQAISASQQKMIVYAVPKMSAVDFYTGNHYYFFGDSSADRNLFFKNYTLASSRNYNRILSGAPICYQWNNLLVWNNNLIVLLNKISSLRPPRHPVAIDILIIKNNCKPAVNKLLRILHPKVVVLDGSNSLWKIEQWRKQCEELHLPCYSVLNSGAFMLSSK